MVQTTAEARQQLLDTVARATDQIGFALAALGAAYEQLDDRSADQPVSYTHLTLPTIYSV